MHRYTMGKVSFSLREYRDLSFLNRFGTPFCVFDRNVSGNIGFGMEKDGVRRFIKIAGLPTLSYDGDPRAAADSLRRAADTYASLTHPALIAPTDAFACGGLFVMVFPYEAGECLWDYWNFETYRVEHTERPSPAERFRTLPIERHMTVLQTALSFLAAVSRTGYIAIDFYDGSLLYDFETDTVRICDIDFFERAPHINRRGLMWGDDKFRAPEEYEMNAVLDERTNVFRAGAMMHYCLGAPYPNPGGVWESERALLAVAKRATAVAKEARYATVSELIAAWHAAGGERIE